MKEFPIQTEQGTDIVNSSQISLWQALMASSQHPYGTEASNVLQYALTETETWAIETWGDLAVPEQGFYIRLAQSDDPERGLPDPKLYFSQLSLRTELSEDLLALVSPNNQSEELGVFKFYKAEAAQFRHITLSPHAEDFPPYLQSLLLLKEVFGMNVMEFICGIQK